MSGSAEDGDDRGESYWGVACTCDASSPLATWLACPVAGGTVDHRVAAPTHDGLVKRAEDGWDVWESPELPRCGADLTHAVCWVHTGYDDTYGPHHDRHIVWCSDCKRVLIVRPQDDDPERVYPRTQSGREEATDE